MAHNINFNENTGKHSFFTVKEIAWHGLGQIVEQYPNSKDAISHAGLDYNCLADLASGKRDFIRNRIMLRRREMGIALIKVRVL